MNIPDNEASGSKPQKTPPPTTAAELLRLTAEEIVANQDASMADLLAAPDSETKQLILHELRVHQIELEMQNEELRQSQLDLETARHRWFDLYNLAPVAYCTLDAENLITQSNLTLSNLLGVPRSELNRQPFVDFVDPKDRDQWYLLCRHLNLDHASPSCELRVQGADGLTVWVHCEATSGVGEGGEREFRMALIDIGERRRAEAENTRLQEDLRQSHKLQAIGLLAGGVAHEFNNMLTVILGNAEDALLDVDEALPIHSKLKAIETAAKRSAEVTGKLLAFARKQPIDRKLMDLNERVEKTLKLLRQLIGRNIVLVWEPEAFLWPITMDSSQMDQILTNLCLNAKHASDEAGGIRVRTFNCSLTADFCAAHADAVPGDYIRLSVVDKGCGMDEDTLAQIFVPFFTTKDIGKGTGLGLASVYGAVRQNEGFIDVSSKLNEGTTVDVYLPRRAGQVEIAPTATAQNPADLRGQETILLVEDEPAVRQITSKILAGLGYLVLEAGSAAEAIRLATSDPVEIHLLLSDVSMPGMNGRDLASALLKVRPSLKSLFMSGHSPDFITSQDMLESGVPFLQKPFSTLAFKSKVREVLNGEPGCTEPGQNPPA
ncbi:MAG: two-component system cell cycle sensor histidine kinase/response regulator CckA [Planctomycetota bacterium]|jgi:two-component system cell cycle sensor histidine kinase/response regulator CckA